MFCNLSLKLNMANRRHSFLALCARKLRDTLYKLKTKFTLTCNVQKVIRALAFRPCHAILVFWLAVCSKQVAIQILICWANGLSYWNIVSWLRWQATLPLFQRGKSNFFLVVRLSKSRNMLTASSFTSNRLQYSFKVPTKWDGGSGKTKIERTRSRYSKCGGICGVLQGF